MSVFLSHSGKQHSYQVAKALQEINQLYIFYTSSYVTIPLIQNLFLVTSNNYFTRRFIKGLSGKKVNSNWRFEVKEILYRKLFGNTNKALNAVYERDIKFDYYVSQQLKKDFQHPKLFWGFQGSCYTSLQSAKKFGMFTICEQSATYIGFYKRILEEEKKLNPEWADSIDSVDYPLDYEKRLYEEPFAADHVIVASKFSKDCLINSGMQNSSISILPLGTDLIKIKYLEIKKNFNIRPLKVLYVGRITQSKGIKYLLEAIKKLNKKDFELTLIGNIQGSGKALEEYRGYYSHIAGISQTDLFEKYHEYDVLVNPSLSEGFGLVIIEAMAAGLPVITTPNTMGSDLIINDINGYLVPIRDSNAIITALETIRNKNSKDFDKMQSAARESSLNFSWICYTERLKIFLNNLLARK